MRICVRVRTVGIIFFLRRRDRFISAANALGRVGLKTVGSQPRCRTVVANRLPRLTGKRRKTRV